MGKSDVQHVLSCVVVLCPCRECILGFQSAVLRKGFLHNSVAGLTSVVSHICGRRDETMVKQDFGHFNLSVGSTHHADIGQRDREV